MENSVQGQLAGFQIHGFRTMADLDIRSILEETKTRWLRPNEIHAILCNYKYFSISVKPVNLPKSGTIVLFDRKMLRNFRKDGHNWKKKKDGKTVKEAHEHLKVGSEERIHVYYAHGEDNPTFVRRCYWLLDKALEHIVLVHYRETQEGSPATPVNSNSSGLSDPPTWVLSEESDSAIDGPYHTGLKLHMDPNGTMTLQNHEQRLHEINTLEWDELLVPDDANKLVTLQGKVSFDQQNQCETNVYRISAEPQSLDKLHADSLQALSEQVSTIDSTSFNAQDFVSFQTADCQTTSNLQAQDFGLSTVGALDALNNQESNGLRTQDSFGRWMNGIMIDSPGSVDDLILESSTPTAQQSLASSTMDHHQLSKPEHTFNITEISPAWAFSNEEAKILVIGYFLGGESYLGSSGLFCVCGDACIPVENVQMGVYRCVVSPQVPGVVNLYLSLDGQKPISQVVTFEFRAPTLNKRMIPSENKSNLEEFQVQMRLAHLLFSTSKSLKIFSTKVSHDNMKEAKIFARKTSHISDNWACLIKSIEDSRIIFSQAKESLFELILQNRLQEWLLERIVEGCKICERDEQGQGVIHLCAILGYTWAVYPFLWSGFSIDYRDKFGWTALHWAAYYGRVKMVATLLSAGAKPNLVTDPTSENPGGCTAADLASKNGYDGLAAYLAEKGLVAHFEAMSLAGNVSGSLQTSTTDMVNPVNFTEEDSYLKDTLAAYRTAADAAARIQAAFREHSFQLRTKAVESFNPEIEARNIVAAMRIQHAFRNYETRKKMAAAARIQYRFRTWKMRKEFLNMRRQVVKIQAVFRGFQVRKQYRKIVWSVGVLEKAILRWRLKRKGFRGLQVRTNEGINEQKQDSDVEEDFFRASRKQAEERVERSVVRVQAMFRSKRAQEEYRKMKLAHNIAELEYGVVLDPERDMGQEEHMGLSLDV